jgi:serine/threonine protein kinase
MAPEVINSGSQYDTKADIWSLGITIYEMVMGAPPHANQEAMRVLVLIPKVKPPRLPETLGTPDMREFIASVLRELPADVSPVSKPHSMIPTYGHVATNSRGFTKVAMDEDSCQILSQPSARAHNPL